MKQIGKIFSLFTAIVCFMGFSLPFNAGADGDIRIAAIYAISGIAAKSQEGSVRGVKAGVDEVNSWGGVLGKKLSLILIDNKSTPLGSKAAAKKAVSLKITAIIGSSWSSHTIPAAKIAQAEGIPLITNISTLPEITQIGNYIFRVCFNDLFQGKIMAQFSRLDLKTSTAVVFENINSDYSMSLAKEFCSNFEKLGGKILLRLNYKEKQEDFSQIVLQARQVSPDVLFIPGYDESALIIQQAHSAGLKAIPVGGDGWDMPGFLSKSNGKAAGGYYCTHWAKDMQTQSSRIFLNKFSQHHQDITSDFALAYDAVLLLADAIKRAGSLDTKAIRDALARTSNFDGVTGNISFQGGGDPNKSAVIMKITESGAFFVKSIHPE